MKQKFLIIIILISFVSFGLQAQNNDSIFNRLSENKEITKIVVPKNQIEQSESMNIGLKTKDLSKKIDVIEIYASGDKDAIAEMKQEVSKFDNDADYEELMNIKDDGETVTTYAKLVSEGLFKEIILVAGQDSECAIIRMIGAFSLEDVQGVTDSIK